MNRKIGTHNRELKGLAFTSKACGRRLGANMDRNQFSAFCSIYCYQNVFVMMIMVQACDCLLVDGMCERQEETYLITCGRGLGNLSRNGRVWEIADCDRTGFFLPGMSTCDFAYGSNSKFSSFSLYIRSHPRCFIKPLFHSPMVIQCSVSGTPFSKTT